MFAMSQNPTAESVADPLVPFLAEFIRNNPVVCPACGTDLHDLVGNACPKCHAALTIGLTSRSSYRVSWGTAFALFAIDAAIGIFFAIAWSQVRGGPRREVVPIFILYITSIPIPIILLVLRRRFLRTRVRFQRGTVILACLWTLSLALLFLLVLWR